MPATALLTIADLERMPDDGVHRELLHGELIELPPPKTGHGRHSNRISRSLGVFVDRMGLGELVPEVGFRLFPDGQTCLQPDLAFVRMDRARKTADEDYYDGAPDLAIEIISPSEGAADIESKVQAYLAAGAIAIWLIYPRTRTVRVIRRDRMEATLGVDDVLGDSELFPGWQIAVRDLFASA